MSDTSINTTLQALEVELENVESLLHPLLETSLTETAGKLNPTERCKLHVLLAYTISSLFYVYLKAQGVSPKEHPVIAELERIKGYMERINKLEQKSPIKSMQVDPAAAKRFVKHALASASKEESKKTRKKSKKGAKKNEAEDMDVDMDNYAAEEKQSGFDEDVEVSDTLVQVKSKTAAKKGRKKMNKGKDKMEEPSSTSGQTTPDVGNESLVKKKKESKVKKDKEKNKRKRGKEEDVAE